MKTNSGLVKVSVIIATVLFLSIAIFQILVLLGVFPVSMTWGGQFETITPVLMISNIIAFFLLTFFACVIWIRAEISKGRTPSKFFFVMSWVITGLMLLNTLGNITSKSALEKMIFTPATIILFVTCLIVSLSKTK